ncbi:TPR-like protein [Calocera viscosa TUFC12733]|uniref:TPR-like protein n=1 Tax=Calocera viscosa (strain TUFC12733) TaxID=1330018 RepID=A0A167M910_CALVF|nr:TPR-like protein [Calocera viscosa TUFC12733]
MNAISGTPKRQKSGLRDLFAQWKAGASSMLEPMKERLVEIPSRLVGIHDLIKEQRDDIRQLGEMLALINEQILSPGRLSPNSNLDAPTMKLLQELINVAADAEELLETLRSPSKRLKQLDEPEELANLDRRLSSLMLQLSLRYGVGNGVRVEGIGVRVEEIDVRVGEIGVRIAVLEREAAGSLAGQVPEDLLLAEIPAAPVVFHGRDNLVKSIVELLCRSETCRIPLLGPGGIGKTSVAATVINDRRVKAKYGQRILFVSCEGLVTAEGILNALAASLHAPPGSDVRSAVLACLSSPGCILLILDNLETAWDSPDKTSVEQLLRKLTELSSLSLLVTMRGAIRPAGVDWAATCADPITPLSLDAARQLWTSIARHHDENLDRLLNRLDGLPLAITLMAHQGQLVSPTDLLEAYDSERTALVETDGGGRLTSLDVSIRLSINCHTMSQNPNAAQLLSVLCLLPEGVTISDLPKILPTVMGIRKSALALIAVALAINVNGRLRALAPIRHFVMEHLPPGSVPLAELRAHYMLLAHEAEKLGTDQSIKAITSLSADFGNINSVLRHCWKDASDRTDVEALCIATDWLSTFSHLTLFGDCLPLLEDAKKALESMGKHRAVAAYTLAIGNWLSRTQYMPALELLRDAKAKFETIGNRLGAAQCMKSIGDTLRMLDRYDDALSNLEQAKAEFESIGDRLGAAYCMESVGDTLYMLHRNDDALSTLEQAKAEFETIGDRLRAAGCLQSIGNTLRMLHRYDDALSNLERAKAEFESIGDRLGAAECILSMGETLRMLHRYDDALSNMEQAKTEFETLGTRLGAAQCMERIGDTLYMVDRYDDALSNLEQAKAEFETIGDRLGAAGCMRSIGSTLRMLDRYDDALSNLEQAKAEFETIGDRLGAAGCMQSIGNTLRMLHRYDDALSNLERAKAESETIRDRPGAARCMQSIGLTLSMLHRYDDALSNLEQAKAEFETIGDRLGAARCMQSIGDTLRMLHRDDDVLSNLEQAKAEFMAVGDRRGVAQCMRSIGKTLRRLRRYDAALPMLEQAKAEFDTIGDRVGTAECGMLLGYLAIAQGDSERAEVLLKQSLAMYDEMGILRRAKQCRRKLAQLRSGQSSSSR